MIIAKGMTKVVRNGPLEKTVILKTLDVLTGGDAAKKEKIKGIGAQKTTQATNVFSLLNKMGLPRAFIRQASSTELLCHHCQMLPMELVVRRYAFGSPTYSAIQSTRQMAHLTGLRSLCPSSSTNGL